MTPSLFPGPDALLAILAHSTSLLGVAFIGLSTFALMLWRMCR